MEIREKRRKLAALAPAERQQVLALPEAEQPVALERLTAAHAVRQQRLDDALRAIDELDRATDTGRIPRESLTQLPEFKQAINDAVALQDLDAAEAAAGRARALFQPPPAAPATVCAPPGLGADARPPAGGAPSPAPGASEPALLRSADSDSADSDSAEPRASVIPCKPEAIPFELRRFTNRWDTWRAKWNDERQKWDKRPACSTNSPWGSFERGRRLHEASSDLGGLGFLLTVAPAQGLEPHGLIAIDLDRCVDGTGRIDPWAQEVIKRAGGYTERSPSGRGVRIFVRGELDSDWTNHERGIEVYGGSAARFVTVTGHRLPGSAEDVRPAPEGFLEWLASTHRKTRKTDASALPPDVPELISEDALPKIADLNLPVHALTFLAQGEHRGDASAALAAATAALLEATADSRGELQHDKVLSILAANQYAMEVALRHRGDDQERAVQYLWRHHVQAVKVRPVVADFDVLPDDPAARSAMMTCEFIDFSSLAHTAPPKREEVVPGWIPRSTVVYLAGSGGLGKTTLAQQLAFSVANGEPWLGLKTVGGSVLGLFGEDDSAELLRRASRIFEANMLEPDKASTGLYLDARAGKDNLLMTFNARRVGRPTALFDTVREHCAEIHPALVVLDNVAQLFGGEENDRGQVTQFINSLTGVARDFNCAVLLLGHPAKTAGSEYSGSTAWENAVRTRLFLDRQEDGTLLLRKAKSNYSALEDIRIEYRFPPGVFVRFKGNGDLPQAAEAAKPVVVEALRVLTARQQATSHVRTARNYLPKLMAGDDLLGDVSQEAAARALGALIDAGEVLPNQELSWRTGDRHRVRGLAARGGV